MENQKKGFSIVSSSGLKIMFRCNNCGYEFPCILPKKQAMVCLKCGNTN